MVELTGNPCFNLQVLNNLEVLGMPMRPQILLFLLYLPLLDKAPQHSHLLIQMLSEVKLVEFCQSQLAVVIIKALLGDSQHLGCLLQVDLLFIVIGLGAIQMQIPPFLDQADGFSHRPFSASHVFLLLTVHVITRGERFLRGWVLGAVPDEYDRWFQQILMEDATIRPNLPKGDKGVRPGFIDVDAVGLEWTVAIEDMVEVDELRAEVYVKINYDGLRRLLVLEHKGLLHFLVR